MFTDVSIESTAAMFSAQYMVLTCCWLLAELVLNRKNEAAPSSEPWLKLNLASRLRRQQSSNSVLFEFQKWSAKSDIKLKTGFPAVTLKPS
jgi:hypothetical protein